MDQINSNNSEFHANGELKHKNLTQGWTRRDDSAFFEDAFPNTEEGKLLQGIVSMYLIKQEPRMGWAKRSACSDSKLLAHPIESVASHMWALATLISVISKTKQFQDELPEFNHQAAFEMALIHDVPELVTGDFTPDDEINVEQKHELERDAMDKILANFPDQIGNSLRNIYASYESRDSSESKFVKDCDRLDFILTAFLYERQGFNYIDDFYENTVDRGFFCKFVENLALTLVKTRNELVEKNLIYKRKPTINNHQPQQQS